MSARDELIKLGMAESPVPGRETFERAADAFRAEIQREDAATVRAQAPKYLDNEVDMAIFWALDSAAGKIVADDKS